MIRHVLAALMAAALTLTSAPARADADLAEGLAQLRAGDWAGARAVADRMDDPALRDVILWHVLRNRQGTFAQAEAFLARNPDWPGLGLLRTRVEAQIPATAEPERVVAFFDGDPPSTSRGTLLLATALQALGRGVEAEALVIDYWIGEPATAASHAGFLELYGDLLTPFHGARLDALAWSGDTSSAERTLPLVDGPEAALARARIALREDRDGVDALIDAVPEEWRDHQGLAYERFRWRIERGRRGDALELLFAYDESADALGEPGAWADHRLRLARDLKQDGFPAEAYRVAARHHLAGDDRDFAQLEWLAGYLALRFLGDAGTAADHFRAFDGAVASPISKGRAGYWLGRALEELGDEAGAQAAYAEGGRYQTSFYGQLAAERGGLPADPLLTGAETFPPLSETSIADSSVLEAALALHAIGERSLAERFMAHMAEGLPRAEIGSLIDVALGLDEPHIALLIAKRAALAGHELHAGYFPTPEIAPAAAATDVPAELTLAIARRESEFDPVVMSGAGARGLMQLMPGTAREMAGALGEDYSQSRLTADPAYNARLGTAYLAVLEGEFGPSTTLVPAAYNAGPSRARAWRERFGDPSDPAVDIVDWIEDVPFRETRNYIMRVSESLLPYRARLTGEAGELSLGRWLREGYGDLRR
jgi:soluble lytic murein transglycosylase